MLLGSYLKRAVKLINKHLLIEDLHSLEYRRKVGDNTLFYQYIYKKYFTEILSCIPSVKNSYALPDWFKILLLYVLPGERQLQNLGLFQNEIDQQQILILIH